MEESFWPKAPRENFSKLCMAKFGCTFDAPVYKVTSETAPVVRSKKRKPIYATAHDALSGYSQHHRGQGTQISERAMKKGALLGGEAR